MIEEEPVPNISPDALSSTELRITKFLLAGCTLDEVASNMNVTPQVIESHCDAVYAKLGIHDAGTFVRWAERYDVRRW